MIRRARAEDLPLLGDVELRAGRMFETIGMPEIAGDLPAKMTEDEVVFVAEEDGAVVGYVQVLVIDDGLHIEQVSVVPEVAGRRLGAALIDRAADHARALGLDRLTLTTFRDVPWNRPYYERTGFAVLEELGPELTELVAHQRAVIPGDAPRVCMTRPVLPEP